MSSKSSPRLIPSQSPRMTRAQSQLLQQEITQKMAEDPSLIDQLKGIMKSYSSKFGRKKSCRVTKKSHNKSRRVTKKSKKKKL
jgi:hypothetical protein